MPETRSVVIAGVGGQGTLLASRVLGSVLLQDGLDVKVSEVHGMSQRGGSVVTYVRYGAKVFSPVIDEGEADVLLAFEELEAARYLPLLKRGGLVLLNKRRIDPMPVITGAAGYPEDLVEVLQAAGARVVAIDAQTLAEGAGSAKAVNVVLLGLLARHSEFPREHWQAALTQCVPARFLEMNKRAFAEGCRARQ